MINKFRKVTDGLYRGSAPSPFDVIDLKKHFNINKIISLDENAGKKIDKIVKLLNINHITIPINGKDIDPIAKLMSYDLKDLLIDDGPTFVHCIHGKDRTGMVIAMFECKYMNKSFKEAMKDAIKIGFGIGLPPDITDYYVNIIKQYCKSASKDSNNVDIVDNALDHPSDWRGSVLDSADMASFAPFFDTTRKYPYDSVYNYKFDQYPTRDNFDTPEKFESQTKTNAVPDVGLYENSPPIGVGPIEPGVWRQI